ATSARLRTPPRWAYRRSSSAWRAARNWISKVSEMNVVMGASCVPAILGPGGTVALDAGQAQSIGSGPDDHQETTMSPTIDYSRYRPLEIGRRGPLVNGTPCVLDIRMRADGPGGNGKLPPAGHEGHWELSEIWRDVGRDDSVRAAVLRGSGM